MHPEKRPLKVDVHLPRDVCSLVSPETPVSELKAAAQQHYKAPLDAHCKSSAARFDGHAERIRVARWGHGGGLANWLPPVGRLLGMLTRARL